MHRCINRLMLLGVLTAAAPVLAVAADMAIPGKFHVSESGAAIYSLPIDVPPGTSGISPHLGLIYNSQEGNGLVGIGWSLSGLSSITRCPQTIAQDNAIFGVNYDGNDRFCLDGQRLIVSNGYTYGQNGAEYHTERDTFAKITSYADPATGVVGPTWFKVQDKAGHIIEYGNTSDSRILALGTAVSRVWAINKLQDRKGNYQKILYTVDTVGGNFYPLSINYTGNATVEPNNSVSFEYTTSRPDVNFSYQAGSMIKSNVLLSKIKTISNGALVKEYRLGFGSEPSTQRSRLVSILACSSVECLPATTMTYESDRAPKFGALIQSNVTDWGYGDKASGPRAWVDVNGDGKVDYCRLVGSYMASCTLSNGNGFGATITSGSIDPGYLFTIGWVDVNGDGLADFCRISNVNPMDGGGFAKRIKCNFSTPNGFDVLRTSNGAIRDIDPGYEDSVAWVDVNGDGRADYCRIIGNTYHGILACTVIAGVSNPYVTGAAAAAPGADVGGIYTTEIRSAGTIDNGYVGSRHWVDVDGDGRADFCRVVGGANAYRLRCTLSTGIGFGQEIDSGILDRGYIERARWVDVNGDGKADYCRVIGGTSNGYRLACALFTGKGFVDQVMSEVIDPGYIAGSDWVDVNGDGKADFCRVTGSLPNQAILNCMLSNGTGFGPPLVSDQLGGGYDSARAWVDFTGDGKSDYCRIIGDTNNVSSYLQCTPIDFKHSGLTTLIDGLGQQTTLQYKPLTDNSVYTKYGTMPFPRIILQTPQYVVSKIISSTGRGMSLDASYVSTYSYNNLMADLSGRGIYGFSTITSQQEDQVENGPSRVGLVTTTNYRMDWPFIGVPSNVEKKIDGRVLSTIKNDYDCIEYLTGAKCSVGINKIYTPYLSTSTQTNVDLNGTPMPTIASSNQMDKWGNILINKLSVANDFSRTTTNSYTNDESKWLLGRLDNSTISSVTPQGILAPPVIGGIRPPSKPVDPAFIANVLIPILSILLD